MLLCVRFTVRKLVFNCEFVWAEREFMPLVACCLLLVACCLLLKIVPGVPVRVKCFSVICIIV